jgi:glucose-6-phosphate isomerase
MILFLLSAHLLTYPSLSLPPTCLSVGDSHEGFMLRVDWSTGALDGSDVRHSRKTLGDLKDLFGDRAALDKMPPDTLVYRVQWWSPVPEGTEGGLFWGTTIIEPGQVGQEFFMTHGHFHHKADRTEFYSAVSGTGALILMDKARKTWFEPMSPGTLHHIPPRTAHRVANTGSSPLHFVACWPSDAGYDYNEIKKNGFSARLISKNGIPTLTDGNLEPA